MIPPDWDEAKRHFDYVRKQYQLLEGTPGERSQDLHDAMMAVE